MCGIAGWCDPRAANGPESRARLKAMCDTILHRGPDDEGYFVADGVALGMRRLSIVDIDGGSQPMQSTDSLIQLVFNGEIYNHDALRTALAAEGVSCRTRSDTEVILRLYECHGLKAFDRLNGMFAIAIFDDRCNRLVLVRDRLGVKPLYYAFDGERLVFASEIKAIIAALPERPEINPRAIWDYLTFRYVPAPHTMWQGITKLPPGHRLTIDRAISQRPKLERWWDIPRKGAGKPNDEKVLIGRFGDLLQNAVDRRMRADVPVGILLSGGLDSSVIAALAAPSHPKLSTFSVSFVNEDAIDERRYARMVADHLRTDHHEVVIGQKDFIDFLPDFVHFTDEPLADLASIPLHYVSRLAGQSVKVVLSGEGSDEILGGYNFDIWAARWDEAKADAARSRRRLARLFSAAAPASPDPALLDLRCMPEPPTMTAFMTSAEKQALLKMPLACPDSLDGVRQAIARYGDASPLSQALYSYCQDWLVEDLLMKADKMSMANSIELRTPFLDFRVVEMAAQLPDSLRVGRDREGRYCTKRILREMARPLVPDEIISRPKMGFPVPVYDWLSDRLKPMAHDCVASHSTRLRNWFEAGALENLVALGTRKDAANVDRHRLWNMMILEFWLARWSH